MIAPRKSGIYISADHDNIFLNSAWDEIGSIQLCCATKSVISFSSGHNRPIILTIIIFWRKIKLKRSDQYYQEIRKLKQCVFVEWVDVQVYLNRIGNSQIEEPSYRFLETLINAHLETVPFENLDVM